MGSHGSIATELRLRADDLKQVVRPKVVKGMTRSEISYTRPEIAFEPLHGKEVLLLVGRFRHHIDGSGTLLSDSWQTLTYDLAAVEGISDGLITSFQSATNHHLQRWLNEPGRGNDAERHVFILGPGELVRAVDFSWASEVLLEGLRLRTNQRQSPWFGRRNGVIKTITAPHGYFINAIKPMCREQRGKWVWEIGLRLCPIIDHVMPSLTPRAIEAVKSECVGEPGSKDGQQIEFTEKHAHLRAIIVDCGKNNVVRSVHALSSEEFERHLAHRDAPLPQGEHLVFLRHSEYVKRVDVIATDRVHAIRVATNLCESPCELHASTDVSKSKVA
ncbi:hypothetical protein ATCC90586_003645 [Pythium insidiosum]|nr:hypothetical protein ATCC90586_003645 [Pythium insidiosum]